ncbi:MULTISPECIES: hypothetical protein [Halocynthiibacter]|uniref:Uncharacterized protein n=1 Tax=Halocynthiibacter halioticoli TaxID=2986804 RepID=A0AAE3J0E3_9RHOB|nr:MULTISPECIES: hypothetical protein [Halocynthiibacter]MCV6824228.1 hypothetical protein [Halocynthiibacter halioticoli]MCW4057229.1 hypothetical protein [Halocynthiibacter sp. SDUM655004]
MNASQLLNMIIRIIVRRMINGGINKGIDLAARGRQNPDQPLTPEEKAKQNARAKDMRQKSRLFRRMGRF